MRYKIGGLMREVKTGVLEGCLVPFTEPLATGAEFQGVDLLRTYFDLKTNYYINDLFHSARSFFRHLADPVIGDRLLGAADLTIREANGTDPAGVWAQNIITIADEYDEMILALGRAGKLRHSSGVSESMYAMEPVKIGTRSLGHITRWGIVDSTLTPSPASIGTTKVSEGVLTAREFYGVLGRGDMANRNIGPIRPIGPIARRRQVEDEPDDTITLDPNNPFEAALAEFTPSRWQLEDVMTSLICQAAMMAKMAVNTGGVYDYAAQVTAIMTGYARIFGASIVDQIEDWIEQPPDEWGDTHFYVRSLFIDDTTLENHVRALESGLLDVMKRFSGRRSNRGVNRGLNQTDAGRLTGLRVALLRAISEGDAVLTGEATGTGERISADESARLRERIRQTTEPIPTT